MIVYVESNFIVELALNQEQAQAARSLLSLARRRRITLAVPAFALAESVWALRQKEAGSRQLATQVEKQLAQARRTGSRRALGRRLLQGTQELIAMHEQALEQHGLVCDRIRRYGTVLNLSYAGVSEALRLGIDLSLDRNDALVLGTILDDLGGRVHRTESIFASRDRQAFAKPEIDQELRIYSCRWIGNFDAAVGYLTKDKKS